jgi:ribosomal protein S18 acetylase RimI-like enzyme
MSAGPTSESRPLDPGVEIREARAEEIEDLLPLMRGYCDFYKSDPPDDGLRGMARTLIGDRSQGFMLIARQRGGEALGFATVDWKWSMLKGARVGYLEDLFVSPDARGRGIADALIEACAHRCRERGMPVLQWLTATDNHRAQAVYDRVGGSSEAFLEYELPLKSNREIK